MALASLQYCAPVGLMAPVSLHCVAPVGLMAPLSLKLSIATPDMRLGKCLKASSMPAQYPRRLGKTGWLHFLPFPCEKLHWGEDVMVPTVAENLNEGFGMLALP